MTETMTGVLVFHSETGTEGGYYAFQDAKFMGLPGSNHWRCPRCGRVWDKNRDTEPPKPRFTYWRDMEGQLSPEGYRYVSSFAAYDEPHDDLPEGSPSGADVKWNRQRNAVALVCYTGGHAEWEYMYPNGIWSYEGLHMLHDGDHLHIWNKEKTEVVWAGDVKLRRVDSYGPEGGTLGLRVHQKEDVGVGEERWLRWFLDELPAELTSAEKKEASDE